MPVIMTGGDVLSVDAKAVYVQSLAIADYARQLRLETKTCSTDQVDGILETYAAARTLCHEVTCGEKTVVSLTDLGRIAYDKTYAPNELNDILTGIEVECFRAVGALARIIVLIPKGESPHE